jgi:hypothetical protein
MDYCFHPNFSIVSYFNQHNLYRTEATIFTDICLIIALLIVIVVLKQALQRLPFVISIKHLYRQLWQIKDYTMPIPF